MRRRITVKPGERVEILTNWSDVTAHMGVANKLMEVEIVGDAHHPAVQLYKDGEVFSSPIGLGEAGIYSDKNGYYAYTKSKVRARFTYEARTLESVEQGESEDHGFYTTGGWKYSLCGDNRDEVLAEAQAGEYDWDGDLRGAIREAQNLGIHECSCSSIVTGHEWWSSVDPDIDYATGEHAFYSLHIEGATVATMRRIDRALNGQKIWPAKIAQGVANA